MANDDRALYIISVAAELAGVHPQTLRIYERKGLIEPARTVGRSRRYSDRDIALLRRIQELTNQGVGLPGVADPRARGAGRTGSGRPRAAPARGARRRRARASHLPARPGAGAAVDGRDAPSHPRRLTDRSANPQNVGASSDASHAAIASLAAAYPSSTRRSNAPKSSIATPSTAGRM